MSQAEGGLGCDDVAAEDGVPSSSSAAADHLPPDPNDRYFCHVCDIAVTNVGTEFTCPRCSGGFLEKIETGGSSGEAGRGNDEEDDEAPNPFHFVQNIMEALLQNQSGVQAPHVQHARNAQNQHGQPPHMQFMQNLLQNLGNFQVQVQFGEGGVEGAGPVFGIPLHGDPGDYVWGPGGLDNIVTQLLNQIEGGVPPMSREKIKEIPVVQVSQKQVDNKLQCTTCMDEFALNESVKELPCRHCFHEDCIVPWLQRHDTCPICRKSADASKWNADRTELLSGNQPETQASSSTVRSMMDAIDELD